LAAAVLALSAALLGVACGDDDSGDNGGGSPPDRGTMLLATTTSTRDSGLLDEVLPTFEKTAGCSVKTLAVGSGEAMELGARGDADVLLVHSPAVEEDFMAEGHGASRKAVMHNDFVIVGPPDDPAHISKASDAPKAFADIAHAEDEFASRADESGTNAKELELWDAAGIQPKGSWYIETGQGMTASCYSRAARTCSTRTT
jgi:tungstate transport system substrate-binding protein